MIVEARFNRKEGGNILEEEIVLRLNRGDPAALEALIDCYAPYVCGVAARILPGHPEEWEELAGDVFLAAWDNRKKLRPGQVKGWLSTVARNRAFNRRRGHREDLPLEEDILLLQSDLPQSEAEYRELRSTLSLASWQLGPAGPGTICASLLLWPDGGKSGGRDGTQLVYRQDEAASGQREVEEIFTGGWL